MIFHLLFSNSVWPIHCISVETCLRIPLETEQVQTIFVPEPRDLARARSGLKTQGPYLLSVGRLIERKGHHIAIEALTSLPGVTLLIAASGPEEGALKALAASVGVTDRLYWAGVVPQPELKWWYSAADTLALCSSREGWANVLLEAMACGTPVIATNIWGTPEVVSSPSAGVLIKERSPRCLAVAWEQLIDRCPERETTRAHAEQFSWDKTTQGQLDLFDPTRVDCNNESLMRGNSGGCR